MGTILEQPPREECLRHLSTSSTIDWCKWVQTQAENLGWEISDVLKAFEINQLEKANALALRDGDAKDEQQAGFGELFESLNSAILDLSDSCKR